MIPLRMRGLTPALVVSSLVAAAPAVFVAYERFVVHARLEPMMFALALCLLPLPWLSRLAGRLTYRAALDDIALHVGGEAMPWNTITKVREKRGWRRTELIVERGRTAKIILVTRDLFAGRLEPIHELMKRLPAEKA
jgi:hypothetical protein